MPLELQLKTVLDFEGSVEDIRRNGAALAQEVRREHIIFDDEVLRDFGEGQEYILRVDGSTTKPRSQVKPFGKIEHINTNVNIAERLFAAYEMINSLSPVGVKNAGDRFSWVKYKDHNYVYLNGKVIARNINDFQSFDFEKLRAGDKIEFINIVPYARKLETFGVTKGSQRGITLRNRKRKGGGSYNVKVPNGTYAVSARRMKAMFKGFARVSNLIFKPFTPLGPAGMRKTFSPRFNSEGRANRPYLYPSIAVTIDRQNFKLLTGGRSLIQ
jgi:hypothetical protein